MTYPGRFAAAYRGTNHTSAKRETPMPEHLRSQAGAPYGKNGYIQGLSGPFEELYKWDPTTPRHTLPTSIPKALEGVDQIARRLGSQLNPLLKGLIERSTGKDLFYNKDIDKLDRVGVEAAIYEAIGLPVETQIIGKGDASNPGNIRKRMNGSVLYWLRQPPIGRAVKEASYLADVAGELAGVDVDPHHTMAQSALRFGSGVRYTEQTEIQKIYNMKQEVMDRENRIVSRGDAKEIRFIFGINEQITDETLEELQDLKDWRRALSEKLKELRGEDPPRRGARGRGRR